MHELIWLTSRVSRIGSHWPRNGSLLELALGVLLLVDLAMRDEDWDVRHTRWSFMKWSNSDWWNIRWTGLGRTGTTAGRIRRGRGGRRENQAAESRNGRTRNGRTPAGHRTRRAGSLIGWNPKGAYRVSPDIAFAVYTLTAHATALHPVDGDVLESGMVRLPSRAGKAREKEGEDKEENERREEGRRGRNKGGEEGRRRSSRRRMSNVPPPPMNSMSSMNSMTGTGRPAGDWVPFTAQRGKHATHGMKSMIQ